MSDAPSVLKIVTPTQAAFFRAFTGCWEEGLFFLRNRAPLAPGRKVRVEIVTRDGAALLTHRVGALEWQPYVFNRSITETTFPNRTKSP